MTGNGAGPETDPSWRKLAASGATVMDMHTRLRALVRARLGPDAAAYLAEPQIGPDGQITGWTGAGGAALSPAGDQAALTAKAEAIEARIAGLADTLGSEGDAGRLAGQALHLALVSPEGAQTLWTDGTGPVRIAWGMAARGQATPEAARDPEPPAAAVVVAARPGRGYAALWAIPAVLAAAVLWLGWQASQPLPVETAVITPPAAPSPDPTLGLPSRLAAIETAHGEAQAARPRFEPACVTPPPPPPPVVVAAPKPKPPPPEPVKPKKPKPAKPAPKRAKTLRDVITSRDISGIEGCWRQASPHRANGRNTGLTEARLCFDAKGRGNARYNIRSGFKCREPIRAYFKGKQIVLGSGGTQVCRRGSQTKRNPVRPVNGFCTLSGNRSRCRVPSTGVTYQLVR